jgi:hypothetical protein
LTELASHTVSRIAGEETCGIIEQFPNHTLAHYLISLGATELLELLIHWVWRVA